MAVAIRPNGLHHAVSLGTIEVSSNQQQSVNSTAHFDRNYDSEDENMSRRRLKHTSSTELYPRTSIYSKGDIREQYCLTDRQLNSIERPRRSERFFGCLSRRSGAPQSFLGVCVGRRVPSDDNLAAYAPFYKPPRYPQHHSSNGHVDKPFDADMETSYFRRQPASILSTSKATDGGPTTLSDPNVTEPSTDDFGQRTSATNVWLGPAVTQGTKSSYHCPQQQQQQSQHMNVPLGVPIIPRTKHVSFARSHTLTSFDDVQLGLRSTARMKAARSQERLIGGKKPSVYESVRVGGANTVPHLHHFSGLPRQEQQPACIADGLHQHPMALHPQLHNTGVSTNYQHGHAHLHAPLHMQPYMATSTPAFAYHTELVQADHQPPTDTDAAMGVASVMLCPTATHQTFAPLSPKVVIVEKKFRNAMKTQATQTEQRKDNAITHLLTLSPRTIHKVKVVSQGAQTNGGIAANGKKELAKSLSEVPNGNLDGQACLTIKGSSGIELNEHDLLHRRHSEEPPRSPPNELLIGGLDGHTTIKYYKPPPPLLASTNHTAIMRRSSQTNADGEVRRRSAHFPEGDFEDAVVMAPPPFDYVSNSLPRRACSYHRTDCEYSSNSLPRCAEVNNVAAVQQDMCKHITECAELLNHAYPTPTIDFTRAHLLPPPHQYRIEEHSHEGNELEQKDLQNNNKFDAKLIKTPNIDQQQQQQQQQQKQHLREQNFNRRMSMMAALPQREALHHQQQLQVSSTDDNPFRRDDVRRQSMPVYVKTEKLIDGYAPRLFRSSSRSTIVPKIHTPEHATMLVDEKEIFIDFKPHISPKTSPRHQSKQYRGGSVLLPAIPLAKRQSESVKVTNDDEDEEEECESCGSNAADGGSESGSFAGEEEEEEYEENEQADVGDEEEDLADDEEGLPEHLRTDDFKINDANGNNAYVDDDIADRLYENITTTRSVGTAQKVQTDDYTKRTNEGFWKRSISLDDATAGDEDTQEARKNKPGISAPPSPYRDELLVNASTYPSSDSLTNDATRDHSDGIWNESQVTVLTAAEQKDMSEGSFSSNLLLTPSSKRKNLILQHQQRSSIDTEVLDLEDQLADTSHTYNNIPAKPPYKQPAKESKVLVKSLVAPAIAVTPSTSEVPGKQDLSYAVISPKRSPSSSRRSSKNYALPPYDAAMKMELTKIFDMNNSYGQHPINTDVSECSTTNTDEYATCTDNSKRTPGIKTPPTATSSSSTTQVPVSTQSSQMDKTHGGSSFESASSLYSTRGELLPDETQLQHDLKLVTIQSGVIADQQISKKSPSHSISSTSSGSYNLPGVARAVLSMDQQYQEASVSATISKPTTTVHSVENQTKHKPKIKPESVSDDERSEIRYSSSGYYESPREEEQQQQVTKTRRHTHHRFDEERKKRKFSMKLDIEKENMRALTSPIKRPPAAVVTAAIPIGVCKIASPEKQQTIERSTADASTSVAVGAVTPTDLNKIKRFRPKIRRQFRKSSRNDLIIPRHQKVNSYDMTEKVLESSVAASKYVPDGNEEDEEEECISQLESVAKVQPVLPSNLPVQQKDVDIKSKSIISPQTSKSVPDDCQLKAKSVESLRSVSPGSDSVFYSEADGNEGDQQNHCSHYAKDGEVGSLSATGAIICGDSVESLPYMEHEVEHDIVKPPSDFADSPITTKTTQRLYKKMDKRFRSEERYHGGERGRHYKNRQENIRAKSEERSRDSTSRSSPRALRAAGSSPCVLPDTCSEQNQHIIYRGQYDASRYTRLTDADVWTQLNHLNFDRRDRERDRRASTDSEHSFRSKYQVILHRLVQRRCTLEMYHRQNINTFRVDKTIVVKSDSGEFGFRIHGSKPVVVAAIEPETPAESSGLEVGDIIISVNGVQVLDKHHTEVVKIAHDGCEKLELQVARTIGVLMSENQEPNCQPIYSGFLWRQSGQAKGSPNLKKWVRRWFCLRPDNCLYYYKTENDTQPVGAMIMVKHSVEHCPLDIGKPHAFKVDSGEGIPLYVAADSEELAQHWINVLQQSAKQCNTWLDKCSQNLYQQPSSILKPDCFGYLLKLGSRWCGWSKRYCVLKDACLYFYQDANSKSAFGMACLHGYKVASMSTNAAGKKNAFEIIPPEAKLRHYYFSTESEMDKKRWISALEYSIDRWIKSG